LFLRLARQGAFSHNLEMKPMARLALEIFSAALIVSPFTAFGGTPKAMGFALERRLGHDGGLGKEMLLLQCAAQPQKMCEVQKTGNGVTLSGKISYSDASRILGDFFKVEAKRPASAKSPSQPLMNWGAVHQGKTLKGTIGVAQDRFDLAVLSAEQQILRGFKR
jgi:hypothetical protein